jgi:prepilin-type processing-associated H-X9-DG protein
MVILGVLTAITIPVVGRVRAAARTTQCQSNLRQLHAAISLHASDNKGRYIQGIGRNAANTADIWWSWATSPLAAYAGGSAALQRIAVCQENQATPPLLNPYINNANGYPYLVNYVVMYQDGTRAVPVSSIETPARMLMMVDSERTNWGVGFGSTTNDSKWARVGALHDGKTNALWCDGHVTTQLVDSLKP